MQEEEIILEIFNSERNTLFIQTQNKILLIDLSDKPKKSNIKGDIYINKLTAKDMLLNIRNSPILFQSIKLDNYLNYYIENDTLMMRLDFISENQIFDYKRDIEKSILAFKNSDKTVKLIDRNKDIFSIIHTDEIQILKMDDSMDKIVTICQNGQNINLWNISDLNDIKTEPEMKFYRGKNPCIITSISFNRESSLLALSTDKGTIHIFDIKDYNKNVSSVASWIPFASSLTNYANYKWSFGQIHLDQYVKDSTSIQNPLCQFSSSDLLVVCTPSGRYFEFFLDVSSSKFACNCIKSNLLLSEKFFSERCYFEQDHINFEVLIKELMNSTSDEEVIPKKPKKKKSSKLASTEKLVFPNITNLLRNDLGNNNRNKEEKRESVEEKVEEKVEEEKIEIFEKIETLEKENSEKEKVDNVLHDVNQDKEDVGEGEVEVLRAEVELKIVVNEEIEEDKTLVEEEEKDVVHEENVLQEEKVVEEREDEKEEIQFIEEVNLNSDDDEIIEDDIQVEFKKEGDLPLVNKVDTPLEKEGEKKVFREEILVREVEEVENDNDEIVDDHVENDEEVDEFEVEVKEEDDEEITDNTGTEEEEYNEVDKERKEEVDLVGEKQHEKNLDEKEENEDKEEVIDHGTKAEKEETKEEINLGEKDDKEVKQEKKNYEEKEEKEIKQDLEIFNDEKNEQNFEISNNRKEFVKKDNTLVPSPVLEQATKNYIHEQISYNKKSKKKIVVRRPSRGHRAPGSPDTKESPVVLVESPSQPLKKYVPQGVSNQFKLPPNHKIVLKPTKKSGQSVPLKDN